MEFQRTELYKTHNNHLKESPCDSLFYFCTVYKVCIFYCESNVKSCKNSENMIYTFLIQNTISKQTYSWILEDLTPQSIYHKFDIALEDGMEEGEYEYLLIENPNSL